MGSICFFNTAKVWGGGEKWHLEISGFLHDQGHDVFVVAHKKSVLLQRLIVAKIPCCGIEISNISFLNPLKYKELKTLFGKHNFGTIVMNLSRDVKIAAPCAKKIGIKRIIYRRGSAIPIKNTLLNQYYFGKVLTEILVNSVATKKTILEKNESLFPREKITVIYNGIDISIPKFKNLKTECLALVTLGRLEHQKNHKFLVQLAVELKNKGIDFKILIGGEGRERKELEKLIEKKDVVNQVILSGFIDNPLHFISMGTIFILPSLWEGFGYVLAEAALCKKPIIAFNVSSNPELVINNETGYLIPLNDVSAFANKIEHLYQNPNEQIEMGIKGFNYVKSNFNKNGQLKKIEDYLTNG